MLYIDTVTLNVLDSKSLDDLKFYNVGNPTDIEIVRYGDKVDIPYFSDIEKNNTNTLYGDFKYTIIDRYGLRLEKIPIETDIGVFGCSMTFGEGLPTNLLWHQLLSNKLKLEISNFGLRGIGIQSIVDMFCIGTKHVKMQKAIVVLPGYERIQIMKLNDINESKVINVLPSSTGIGPTNRPDDVKALFNLIPEEELIKTFKNSIYILDLIASLRKIEVYLTSWNNEAYKLLKYLNLSHVKILPFMFTHLPHDYARDKRHPGILSQKLFANKLEEFMHTK